MNTLKKLVKPLTIIPRFLGEIRAELSHVTWVKGKELYKYTAVVLVYAVGLTVLVYIIDLVMVAIRSRLIGSVSL